MPTKKKVNMRRGAGKRMGKGFFGDLWRGVKTAIPGALKGAANIANDALKSSKVLSGLASRIPVIGLPASAILQEKGYGRRRKRGGKKRAGGSMLMRGN